MSTDVAKKATIIFQPCYPPLIVTSGQKADMPISADEYNRILAQMELDLQGWGNQLPHLGRMLPLMKFNTEQHRLPGGRADAETPVAPVRPGSTGSAMQPPVIAPWEPEHDELDRLTRLVDMASADPRFRNPEDMRRAMQMYLQNSTGANGMRQRG